MKLNRRIIRKMIIQEMRLNPPGYGRRPKLSSNLPPLDLDSKTDVLPDKTFRFDDDETTDLDFNRPADIYIDDPAEPTEPADWGDWATEQMPERQPMRLAQRRKKKQDRITKRASGDLDLEMDTEEDTEFTGGAIPSLETPYGFETADQIRRRVHSKADKMSLTKEALRRLILKELADIL